MLVSEMHFCGSATSDLVPLGTARGSELGSVILFLQSKHRECAWFRAGVEADAAAGASVALILTKVIATAVQTITQPHATNWTGLDAETAAFALFFMHFDPPAVHLLFAFDWHILWTPPLRQKLNNPSNVPHSATSVPGGAANPVDRAHLRFSHNRHILAPRPAIASP